MWTIHQLKFHRPRSRHWNVLILQTGHMLLKYSAVKLPAGKFHLSGRCQNLKINFFSWHPQNANWAECCNAAVLFQNNNLKLLCWCRSDSRCCSDKFCVILSMLQFRKFKIQLPPRKNSARIYPLKLTWFTCFTAIFSHSRVLKFIAENFQVFFWNNRNFLNRPSL